MKYFDYFTGELTTKRKQRKRVIKELKKMIRNYQKNYGRARTVIVNTKIGIILGNKKKIKKLDIRVSEDMFENTHWAIVSQWGIGKGIYFDEVNNG